MNTLRWIKMRTDLFSDPEVRLLLSRPDGRDCVLVYELLLTLAGRSNDHGRIWRREGLAFTQKHLAAMLYADEHLIESALDALFEAGLIASEDGVLCIPDWDEDQVAGLEEELTRTATRDRVRKHRERTRDAEEAGLRRDAEADAPAAEAAADDTAMDEGPSASDPCNASDVTCNASPVTCNASPVTGNIQLVTCNADVTPIEIEREKETEREYTGDGPARFAPPSLEAVKAYCRQRGNRVDAAHFVDYYSANGWRVGKNRMRDWKAAVRSWETNAVARASPPRAAGGKRVPPGAVLSPNGIPILPGEENDLAGIL